MFIYYTLKYWLLQIFLTMKLTETAKGLKDQYEKASAKMNKIFYEGFSREEIIAFD